MVTLHVMADLVQGTDEWLAARCGFVTASVIGQLVTPTLKIADNDTSRGLLLSLAAERITSHVEDGYTSPDMWRGILEEPIAREKYAEHHAPVTEVGFMVRDFDGFRIGYSPDGLVGDDGLIEIKSRAQKAQVRTVIDGVVPAANMAQLQCGLLVSGREWIDYVSFSGGMALWTTCVQPIPEWLDALTAAAEKAEARINDIVARYTEATDGLPMTERTPDPYAEPVI